MVFDLSTVIPHSIICTYSRVLSTLRIHSTLRYDCNSTLQAPAPHKDFIMQSTKNLNKIRKNYFDERKNRFLSSRLSMMYSLINILFSLFFKRKWLILIHVHLHKYIVDTQIFCFLMLRYTCHWYLWICLYEVVV